MKSQRVYQGFTLIELLTALGLSSVLILISGVMMRVGLEDHESASRELAWERQSRRVVDQLSEDLKSAFGRKWHEGGEGNSCRVGWLSLKSPESQSPSRAVGDLCAVGYGIEDELLPSGEVRRRLLRRQVDSAEVYDCLAFGNARRLWDLNAGAETLMDGVLVFELWPLLQDGPENFQPWHPELRAMPDAVELRLVIASPELQARLLSSEDWDRACWDLDQFQGDEYHEVRSLIHLGVHGY